MALLSKSLLPFTCRPCPMLTAPCAVQVRFLFLEAVADPKKMAQLNSGQAYAAQVCSLLGCFLKKALQPLFAALDMFLSAGLGSPAVPRLHLWPLYIPGEHSRLSRGRDLLFAAIQCTGRPLRCLLCGCICTLGVPQLPALLHLFADSSARAISLPWTAGRVGSQHPHLAQPLADLCW